MVYAALGLRAEDSNLSEVKFPLLQEFTVGAHKIRFAALDLTGSAREARETAINAALG